MSIILEQLTEEKYKYALAINRDDMDLRKQVYMKVTMSII